MAKLKNHFTNLNPQKIANFKVAALCFLAAATFWVLNALNKDDYNSIVDYPIEIIFDEEEFMPVEKLPNRVKIEINGNGWDLLRKYFKINERPFLIEINNPNTKDFIVTSELRRSLAEMLSPTQLVSMVTDTISFKIDKIISRPLLVKVDTSSTTLARNYRYAGPLTIEPEKIQVRGPSSIVEQFNGTILVRLEENRISKNFSKGLPFILDERIEPLLELSTVEALVKFDVIQMLEGNKRLNLTLVNFPENVSIEDEPNRVIMSYVIDERRIDDLSTTEFEAVVNFALRNRADSTITIQVLPKPSFLEDVRVEPEIVRLRYEKR